MYSTAGLQLLGAAADEPAASSAESTRGPITAAPGSVRAGRVCEIHTRRELQLAISTVTK